MLPTTLAIKKLSLAILLLAAAATSARADNAGISWFKNLERASEVANKTNQPMMIEFWADWCAACKVMDKDIYTDPGLIAAVNGRMVPVRIHFDLQKDLAQKYNVPALPYIVFTNSNGTELMHHRGILSAEELTAVVKAMPADVSELNRLDRALQEDKNHFESLVAMARALRAAGFASASNEYYARALKHKDAKNYPGEREGVLLEMGLNFLELQDAKQAAQIFEACLKEFPQSPNRPDFLLNLANAHVMNAQKVKARKTLEVLIEGFPQSEASGKAKALLKSL
jgi:thioredoxin-like negative regulator of GroEL